MTPAKTRISEEAAQWAVRIHGGALTPQEQSELDAWVAADVRHEGALARARAAWLDLDRLAALAAGRPLPAQPPPAPRTHAPGRRARFFAHRWVSIALIASLGAISLLTTVWLVSDAAADTYVSGVGELRKVPLADGSTMILNTSTDTRVRFDANERSVRLTSGEALFEVAKDPTRPFVVHTGNVTVTAVGTAFVVRKEGSGRVNVMVTEGVVEIKRPDTMQPVQRIAANQRATVSPSDPIRVEQVRPRDAERKLAWRAGMIAFDNEPLVSAIAEFNRYSTRHVVIDDPALSARTITGIFRVTDIDEFAQTTAAALNADVSNEGETIHIRPR